MFSDLIDIRHTPYHLYTKMFEPLLKETGLTQMELDVLLFLKNNPAYDTASELIEIRHLTKSHVSSAIQHLVQVSYLERYQIPPNRKTMHLRILPNAEPLLERALAIQKEFKIAITQDMSKDELHQLFQLLEKVQKNCKRALQKKGDDVI